jgi:hypothetical protein
LKQWADKTIDGRLRGFSMEDEEERMEALLRETLAYIEALDADIKAQARGKVSAALSTIWGGA